MAIHQLALPLPAAYAQDVRDGVSFFAATATGTAHLGGETGVRHAAAVERYLDDLCEFLQRARLIQNNPQHYLDYCTAVARAADGQDDGDLALPATASLTLSLDGVTPADWRRTLRLCAQCAQVLQATNDVAAVVRSGPTGQSQIDTSELQAFYDRTRALALGRARDLDNRSAQRTLCLTPAERALAKDTPHISDADRECCRDDTPVVRKERHARRVLQLVLGHGMSVKKRHEVAIMRDTIRDLVWCCNLPRAQPCPAPAAEGRVGTRHGTPRGGTCRAAGRIHTVINVGEGKGYVSRAVAFCDGLQVIGLDCNTGHKERAVERVENVLEHSLAVAYEDAAAQGTVRERRLINLLYEPRGYMCSIACKVDHAVDWAELLGQHVRTVHDGDAAATGLEEEAGEGDKPRRNQTAAVDDDDGLAKDRCRCCGTLLRRANTAVVLKHIHTHLRCPPEEVARGGDADYAEQGGEPAARLPTQVEVREWLVRLPQDVYIARLMRAFLEPVAASSLATSSRREDTDEDKHDPCTTTHRAHGAECCASRGEPATAAAPALQTRQVARGRRVVVLHAVQGKAPDEATGAEGGRREEETSGGCGVALVSSSCTLRVATLTVVGHDDAARRHRVVFDGAAVRESYRLVALPVDLTDRLAQYIDPFTRDDVASSRARTTAHEEALVECLLRQHCPWLGNAAETWAERKEALVLTVLPVRAASSYAVCVPSLRNCVVIGLHACGDLGAQICRLFARSGARGLLLVSCCWHALSADGFPLSSALRRRRLTIDHVSLQLATQPFDMWASISPTGHHNSARLLFFRGLLSLMWREWLPPRWQSAQPCSRHAQECPMGETGDGVGAVRGSSGGALCGRRGNHSGYCCSDFVPEPHLEPGFLRRMRQHTAELRFDEFVEAVRQEYVCNARASSSTGPCPACRARQDTFLTTLIKSGAVAAFGAEQTAANFAGFVGFTVLRMWMCQLVEGLLLLDRTLYLQEQAMCGEWALQSTAVSLVPLFDGAVSPRMYGILARRA